ncbi:fatty acid desaturase family protein [Chitinophaga tropicalis]|uniref:Fatty acid desaturase n=1 Tax=Chitinophaga tropicalis TaxID=2683588 RepID=A0A7K1U4V9_9BACT|nr:fatty acid desaturase [Chitinophaga tropicalis]MVT09391.1 fatty acid desaturase [Chitinophaga tropicalis]
MLTGKQLILATKPFANETRWKSWYYTLSTIAILLGLYAGTAFVPFLPVQILCSVMSGLVIVRLFVIYHDFQHHTILHRSAAANALFTAFGVFILAPASIWKRSHDYHHAHNSKLFTASIGSYPIMTQQKFLESTPAEQRAYLITRHPLTILFGYLSMFMVGMSIRSFLSSPSRHIDSLLALILHFSAGALICIYMGWLSLVLLLVMPFFIACAIGAYLFYAQHNFPGVTFRDKEGWCHDNAAMASSSYMLMNPFWKWVTANIGYHHIHHLNSRIPFYRLPEAMAAIPELQEAKTTSLTPKAIIACLKLKIWSPEANRMIGVRELQF